MKKIEQNIAFIDGQNLHMGIQQNKWKLDHHKFRIFLKEKYSVKNAYYYFGYLNEDLNDLYSSLQEAGFIVVFREHNQNMLGTKKGNVDTDIVFEIMRRMNENEDFNKIVLVSGDGDYKKLVSYLIKKDRFCKILFPCHKFASSLYKKLSNQYFVALDRVDIRSMIEYTKS